MKPGQVNLDHLTGHFRGHLRGRLRGRFRGSFRGVLEGLKTGKSTLVAPVVGALVGHPARNYCKIIPWNTDFCDHLCNYHKIEFHQNIFFAMLLPLACPCLQKNMRRNLLCKEIVCNFYTINCAKIFFLKSIFGNN